MSHLMGTGGKRLRVAFVATGYPTEDRPNNSIFIHRSIKVLTRYVDPLVIHLRAWLPGRPFIEKRVWEDIPVVSVACPQSPSGGMFHLNAKLLSWFGYIFVRSYLDAIDLIHSTNLYPAGFVASRWASSVGKPHIAQVIGSDLNLYLAPNLKRIGKDWLCNLSGIACVSAALMNRLTALIPDLKNVHVAYMGVDPLTFSPDGPIQGPQSSLPPVRFFFLGGFRSWDPGRAEYNLKGGHVLLDAWQQVETQIQPSSLLISGPGTDIARLEKWRITLHRPEAVLFSRAISPSDIPAFIRACNVVVIPSVNEGLPNVANEAQACGRPVLGTDAGGIPETVDQGKTGYIVKRNDPQALAQGLLWFYGHQNEISVMGMAARQRMLKLFSWDNFVREVLNLYQVAIAHHDSSASYSIGQVI